MNPLHAIAGAFNALRARTNSYRSRFGFFGGRSIAGVRVTHETALQVAAVWACIDCIASAVSSSDWNVYGGLRGADKTETLTEDTLQYVLNSRFNREMTAQSGKRAMMIAAVGFGDGVAEIERDMAGRITGLWPLEPSRVEKRRWEDSGELFYRVNQSGTAAPVDLEPWEVFHIRGAGLTGFGGDDPIGRAIQSIAGAVAIDQFAAAYFANNTQLGIALEMPGLKKLDETTKTVMRDSWNQRHGGVRNSFRVGFMDGGMKLHQLNVDADKAQLIEAKHASIEEICRWFRVPPHKIAHLLHATNNNIEHQGLEFSRDTVRPWKVEIEQECDWSLIPARGPKKFVELDVDWMEQGDYDSRATAYSTLRGCGVFTVNDVLRKLGENTGGPECDVRTMNGASMPLADVGKNMVPNQRQKPRRADEGPATDPEATDVLLSWTQSIYARMADRYRLRMFRDGARANAEELARKDATDFIVLQWKDLDVVILRMRPDIGIARVLDLANQVLDGMTPSDAASELFRLHEEVTT